ncbi:MAG: hypothetical protein HC785_21560, partial [Calothrix sp. CSU_2_0]|nr:hypothetical protein [Calothrix sp. CSU_2_0]
FACFLGWGISEYNCSLEREEIAEDLPNQNNLVTSTNTPASPPMNPGISGKNIIQFTPRVSSNSTLNSETQSQLLSPEEFYSQLQQEDYWDDNEDTNNNNKR